MKLYAARYWFGPKSYGIALYERQKEADDCPHDYIMLYTKAWWRKMGCRVPNGKYSDNDSDEVMAVELTAKEFVK